MSSKAQENHLQNIWRSFLFYYRLTLSLASLTHILYHYNHFFVSSYARMCCFEKVSDCFAYLLNSCSRTLLVDYKAHCFTLSFRVLPLYYLNWANKTFTLFLNLHADPIEEILLPKLLGRMQSGSNSIQVLVTFCFLKNFLITKYQLNWICYHFFLLNFINYNCW